MLGHLGINMPDLVAAKRYYDEIMPLLGFDEFFSELDQFAYMPSNGKPGTFLFFYQSAEDGDFSRHRSGLQHLAFMVHARKDVDAAHRLAQQLDSEIIHAPQDFPQYAPPYYATFWLDPFGMMIEAVCHHDR